MASSHALILCLLRVDDTLRNAWALEALSGPVRAFNPCRYSRPHTTPVSPLCSLQSACATLTSPLFNSALPTSVSDLGSSPLLFTVAMRLPSTMTATVQYLHETRRRAVLALNCLDTKHMERELTDGSGWLSLPQTTTSGETPMLLLLCADLRLECLVRAPLPTQYLLAKGTLSLVRPSLSRQTSASTCPRSFSTRSSSWK
jgi:hypothetical protein